jgi:hypothetical protein
MRRHITYTAAILLASTPAYADFVQSKIDVFFALGYTHFEVERGTVKSKIEGYSTTGKKIEIVIDNVTGAVIRQYTETANDDDTRKIIERIEIRHNDSDYDHNNSDDDHNDRNDDRNDDHNNSDDDHNDPNDDRNDDHNNSDDDHSDRNDDRNDDHNNSDDDHGDPNDDRNDDHNNSDDDHSDRNDDDDD